MKEQPKEIKVCRWKFESDDWEKADSWITGCGVRWLTDKGCTPREDGLSYCPHCGGILLESAMIKNSMIINNGDSSIHCICPGRCDKGKYSDPPNDEIIPIFYSEQQARDPGWIKTEDPVFCDPGDDFAWVCPDCSPNKKSPWLRHMQSWPYGEVSEEEILKAVEKHLEDSSKLSVEFDRVNWDKIPRYLLVNVDMYGTLEGGYHITATTDNAKVIFQNGLTIELPKKGIEIIINENGIKV